MAIGTTSDLSHSRPGGRVHRLCGDAVVPKSRAARRRYPVWATGRHLGDRLRVRRANHRPASLAREIRCWSALPYPPYSRWDTGAYFIMSWNRYVNRTHYMLHAWHIFVHSTGFHPHFNVVCSRCGGFFSDSDWGVLVLYFHVLL